MQPVHMPPWWEGLIQGYLKRTFYEDTRKRGFAERDFTEGDYRFFVTGVRELNQYFTEERGSLAKNYFNQKALRSGYIFYFLPVNALKAGVLLDALPPETLRSDGPVTILDVGSGPGTGMLGTFFYLENTLIRGQARGSIHLRWVLVDLNRHALNDAQTLHDLVLQDLRRCYPQWEIRSEVKTIVGDVFTSRLPRLLHAHDARGARLILGLNLLGELGRDRRLALVQDMMDFLDARGRVLLMEPALRRTTRDLMELHDRVLEEGFGRVHAPCLHQSACPMLRANERDWCHTYIPWQRPPWIEKIDRLVAIRKDYLKCSYLLLGREEPAGVSQDIWRVVSGPLNSKGKSERLLCGKDGLPGLLRVMRLDKDASPANRDFDDLERGDVIELRKTSRVTRETPLKKIHGA